MTRKEAIAAGARFYQGKPCAACGKTERYVSSGTCPPCSALRVIALHQADPASHRETMRRSRLNNPEKYRERDMARHNDERRDANVAAYRKDPSKAWKGQIRTKYGLTPEVFHAMWDGQEGACAICTKALSRGIGKYAVDHCHRTGKVRALLCSGCNTAIGLLKEDPAVARAAAAYLETHRPA